MDVDYLAIVFSQPNKSVKFHSRAKCLLGNQQKIVMHKSQLFDDFLNYSSEQCVIKQIVLFKMVYEEKMKRIQNIIGRTPYFCWVVAKNEFLGSESIVSLCTRTMLIESKSIKIEHSFR